MIKNIVAQMSDEELKLINIEKMAQAIKDYLTVNHSDGRYQCVDDNFYTCGRYTINPKHLAKCIIEYNSEDSKKKKEEKMWYEEEEEWSRFTS